MKPLLLFPDRGFDPGQAPPAGIACAASDLELATLLKIMSDGDDYLLSVVSAVVQASLAAPEEIAYRQEVLADCMGNRTVIGDLYATVTAAVQAESQIQRSAFSSPSYLLYRAIEVARLQVAALRQLRAASAAQASSFRSPGFTRLFRMLAAELDESFCCEVEELLRQLRFRRGVRLSARLGPGNVGAGYTLRESGATGGRHLGRMPRAAGPGLTLTIADRDESGRRTLAELTSRGITLVARELTRYTDGLQDFLIALRQELGFYLGCLRLHDQLAERGQPACVPVPVAAGGLILTARGLCDPALALTAGPRPVIGNDVDADGRSLLLITGANQGGKSTFLRSIGLAQLMMQSGMFVCAQSYTASVCTGLFTHYPREEDARMVSGRLDEELGRMSEIVGNIRPGGLLLCNESFAATNEREGSQLARHVIAALTESGVRLMFVTHFFELADRYFREDAGTTAFLQAGRHADGRRTFRVTPGRPERTSHARDVYERVFAPEPAGRQA